MAKKDKKREEAEKLHAFIVDSINNMANGVLPEFTEFAEKVLSESITDIDVIEKKLDHMLSYTFDDKILVLYRNILRKIYPQAPEVVEFHINEYYEMSKSGDVDFKLVGSTVKFIRKSLKERIKEFFAADDKNQPS